MEDFAWQASWGMGGAYEISEFRQILQTTHVGCYLQPLKMALLDDICRFLNLPRHTVKVAGVLFKAGDAKAHPFRVRPLGKPNINHSAARISSVLRTCQGESAAAAG
ncbi:hypothetical protein BLK75_26830 [Klebsiella pneumoniae]|nr:hypothetical protein BLK75_26830 [Klebsiella pneumoniae]